MAATPLIELDHIYKSFDGERGFAVCDVSISIESGVFVAMVGTSGSGKTTTLKTINRLIEPDRGEVRILGKPINTIDAPRLRRQIGYVFQGIGLFPHMTIAENIGITPQLLNWPDVDISRRVAELLDLVSLPQHYATRLPDALSGGEQQRAGVARAIAARPRIVLMDEPFGALDAVTHDTLSAAYRQIHDRLGLTTIMVTHDVQEAVLRADLIAVMHAGRLLACDTPRMLLSGTADIEVNTLMAAPRRQAEQIGKLLANDSGPI